MKFKTIFILFNAVIIFSFLIIYFMPLMMLGWEYTTVFWSKNWFLPLLFAGVLALLNTYFISNWKLFNLLEREEWNDLIVMLEEAVFEKKKFKSQYIRILINAYLVKSDIERIRKLEQHLREHSPKKLNSHAIPFGIPYLLKNDPEEMETYFGSLRKSVKGPDKQWMDWNYAFTLLMKEKKEDAKVLLLEIHNNVKEPVLKLLTVYLLDAFSSIDSEIKKKVVERIREIRKRFSPSEWEREVEKSKNNVEVVILSKLIDEASSWMDNYLKDFN